MSLLNKLSLLFACSIVLCFGSTLALGQTTVTINSTDAGWFSNSGFHNASNKNYLVGRINGNIEFHNYFVFDLTNVQGAVRRATFNVLNPQFGFFSNDASETYTIYDASTPIAQLMAAAGDQDPPQNPQPPLRPDIFSDLGSGTIYGTLTVLREQTDVIVSTPLNAAGVAALNSVRAPFAFGGAVTTLGTGGPNEYLFAGSGQAGDTRQLVLFTSPISISEFRLSGPSGPNDEFIELYNNTPTALTINSTDGSPGWAIAAAGGTLLCTIPNGTVIPARGHYLAVNNSTSGYSLGSYPAASNTTATGDNTFTTNIPDNTGVAVFSSTTTFDTNTVLDAVGFAGTAAPYFSGTPLPVIGTTVAANEQYSLVRRIAGADVSNGSVIDTGNNAADFVLVSTTGTLGSSTNVALGSPGPENLSSPRLSNSVVPSFVSPTVSRTQAPNRTVVTCANPQGAPCPADPNTSRGDYLTVRRRVTNNTGSPVTRLRFRIVDITTLNNNVAAQADLRAVNSTTASVPDGTGIPNSNITVEGTTLDAPPAQALGGGLNSSLTVNSVSLGTPLAAGSAVDLQLVLGIKRAGAFRFFISIEALP